jgi:hypothetical protein
MEDQGISTQLLVPSGSVCFSYASAPWKVFLRKEVGVRMGLSLASGLARRWQAVPNLEAQCPLLTAHLFKAGFPV